MAPRVLIFVVAYNAERTIQSVLQRIPESLSQYHTEILIIDDSSRDQTFQQARAMAYTRFPLTVLFNPVNQGYGGNQKIGYRYAIENGFDVVVLLHGDGQYAPESDARSPPAPPRRRSRRRLRLAHDAARATRCAAACRSTSTSATRSSPRFRTACSACNLSEFHSGYRVYSVEALKQVPFEANTNDFHFDTEIIIQLLRAAASHP